MTDTEKQKLRDLLTIYYDDTESAIENANDADDDDTELEDLLTSISDVRSSL